SSRRRHTRSTRDWSSDVCSSDLTSRLQFAGATAQMYTGTGTFGAPGDPLFGFANINRGSGLTIDPSANTIYVARLLTFSGSLNKIGRASCRGRGYATLVEL